ncbi:hypothetical protein ACP0HM_30310 [Escherichia coli]
MTDDEYRALMAGEDRYLMTESNTWKKSRLRSSMTRRSTGVLLDLLEAIGSTSFAVTPGPCGHLSGH